MQVSVGVVAHEIRAPLATMRATLELLDAAGRSNSPEVERLMQRLWRSVAWLTRVVDNLGSLAAVEAGQVRFGAAEAHLPTVITGVLTILEPALEQQAQQIQLKRPGRIPRVAIDAQSLGQILLNLLTNANKHGPYGDTIDLMIAVHGSHVRVDVTNRHGPGVPEAEQVRIFEPYVRGTTGQGGAAGLGLGLYVVKTLVELHGGTVGVESVEGRGASFWFAIPLVQPARASLYGRDRRPGRATESASRRVAANAGA